MPMHRYGLIGDYHEDVGKINISAFPTIREDIKHRPLRNSMTLEKKLTCDFNYRRNLIK